MENSETPRQHKWSPAKKGFVLGGIAGVLVSGSPMLVGMLGSGLVAGFWWMITVYPTSFVYRLFGWKWVLESSSDNNSAQIACVAFLVNTILLAVLGSLFGFVVNGFQRNKQ